ncbi:HD domain-containing protein [Bacillus sp. KH172YL63]|uniref:HD domain-containing protein n=1 Tax=Bacillus sp. KH172YL63 TaxID=2709784 RepID=UPI0013E476DB|nr:HD domain-containing protein [Bacillus sp. KH172YL63]BCB03154.1 hydrolase [Bacillus sp. KH172YL63]
MLAEMMHFLKEVDQLKSVDRRTYITDGSRRENSGEHSWHVCVMAMTLFDMYERKDETDLFKALKMLLLHDIVEIDAGDTYAFDSEGYEDKEERERFAADRIFGLLPAKIRDEYRSLWDEFEEGKSNEALYAMIIDHIQPLLLNVSTEGKSWMEHQIKAEQVLKRNRWVKDISPDIYAQIKEWVNQGVKEGWLGEG